MRRAGSLEVSLAWETVCGSNTLELFRRVGLDATGSELEILELSDPYEFV
jgi:hypothetical protein